MMKLKNIHMSGNEHGQLQANTIKAELHDDEGMIIICATLEHILAAIRYRKYEVENVSVDWTPSIRPKANGILCSTVTLDLYE